MRGFLTKAALAAGMAATPLMAHAADKSETVSTASKPSLETQVKQQQAQIDAQNAKIEELEDQLRQVTSILSTRVDRVEAATDSGKVIATAPGPRIEGPNARNSMNFIGAVQVTAGAVDQTRTGAASTVDLHPGTEIRRARIGVQGVAFSDFAYAAEVDLATNGTLTAAAKDLWVGYNGFRPFSFTIGNMKPQTGLEASFSDRSNAQTFVESSMLSSMITATGARNIGLRAQTGGAHWGTSLGVYGDDVNNNGVATAGEEGYGVHGRFTFAPIATPTALLHFGVSGFDRKVSTDGAGTSQIRVRAQPESTIDAARLIDTANIANVDNVRLLGLELAAMKGPVGIQSEWGRMQLDRVGRPDADFTGAYVGANWFLTGESRVYDPRTGVFTRFAPRKMVSPADGTWGAWEVAARWSTLDLNSDPNLFSGTTLLGIRGGEETNYTLGLNWYWNPYFRMMLNYVHADAANRTNTTSGIGLDEGVEADLIGVRVQQEW